MRIEAIGSSDYQGKIRPDGKFDLYIRSAGRLDGPYETGDLAKITWQTQIKKRPVGLLIEGSTIERVITQQPIETLVEDITFKMGIWREKLKRLLP